MTTGVWKDTGAASALEGPAFEGGKHHRHPRKGVDSSLPADAQPRPSGFLRVPEGVDAQVEAEAAQTSSTNWGSSMQLDALSIMRIQQAAEQEQRRDKAALQKGVGSLDGGGG